MFFGRSSTTQSLAAASQTISRSRALGRLLSLSVALLALSLPAHAQTTAVNGKIAYTACGQSTHPLFSIQCDIWVMNSDGSGQTNLTNTLDLNEANPAWSPDGTKIAFIEGWNGVNYLKVIDLGTDGTGRTVTTITPTYSYQFSPAWSPGGTQIALVRQVPGQVMSIQFDIIVVNVDGSGDTNITNSDFDEMDPAWSPDGDKIAFAGVRFEQTTDPITGGNVTAAQWEIVTVNPDGTGEQILSAGAPNSSRAQSLEQDRAPAWSPDSSKLVFMSQSVDPCCDMWKILSVNRDGSNIALLSDNPSVNDLWPSYSPDGTLILFTSDRDATSGGQFDIYTMPASPIAAVALTSTTTLQAAATTGVTRLTSGSDASEPRWGRDPASGSGNSKYTLYVSVALQGKGAGGSVASSAKGISCGHDCSESYAAGTPVSLTATPKKGSVFTGWSGACAQNVGTTCNLTMDDVKLVKATFTRSR